MNLSNLSKLLDNIDSVAKESFETEGLPLSAPRLAVGSVGSATKSTHGGRAEPENKSSSTGEHHDDVASLNEALAKRDREIARLQLDRSELEEACASLKREVRDAWDSFTQAKERAGSLDLELQD